MTERQIIHRQRNVIAGKHPTERMVVLLLAAVLLAGCSAPQQVNRDVITVEGVVTARGNEPFVRYVLETPEGNYYALRIPESEKQEFETPARLQVTGRNYVDDWDGRPFAHIDVAEWARLE